MHPCERRWLGALLGALLASAPSPPLGAQELFRGPSVHPRHGPLRVAPDGRRIVHADGTPFFWLGDTAWELFHRLSREEADLYLEDRRAKGFTVIQAAVLAELDGLRTPNAYGHTPLLENDPTRPNIPYFEHVDHIVNRAARLGMHVGMLPTWGDKFNRKWGVGPEVFTPENARVYGEFLGRRYRDKPIIWILGGDRNPEDAEDLAIARAMAAGLRAGDRGAHLITYHPQGGGRSWQWFHGDEWLDLHVFQSGHGARDGANFRLTEQGYALDPPRPVLDAEPRYEDHPVDWKPAEKGWFDEFDVRQAAYWSLLSGAAGHTYGNHNIWQMWQPGRPPVSSARTPWRRALGQPGSRQMGLARKLFESRPWGRIVPAQAALADPGEGAGHQRAARGGDGSYLVAYTPLGRPLAVRLEALRGTSVAAWWFNPRTGVATRIGEFPRHGVRTFDPPGDQARGNDWVLVLDDAAAGYGAPGK